jgi:soluble lytic murein transglycosylase-like protein
MTDLATTLLQSPEVRQAQQRSKYLQDALAAMQSETPKISSGKEFLTRSLARALTQYGSMRADKKLNEAARSDFDQRSKSLIDSLMPPQVAPQAPTAPVEMPAQAQPAPQPVAPQMQPSATPQAATRPDLWGALIQQESGGRQSAVSPRGAFGRAQLMPDTAAYVARRMGDPSLAERARTDPAVNERLGQAYLDEQMQRFGNPAVALAAYNAGPEKAAEWVQRFGMPEPGRELEWAQRLTYPETRQYVANILSRSGQQQPQQPQAAPQPNPQLDQALGEIGIGQGLGQPSAPASVPAQEQPPMPSPQGVGGNPQPQAPQQPQGNGLQATPQEIALVRQLASDPRTYSQAEALVRKIQERAAAPAEYQSATVNGVPGYYNPRNPQAGLTPFGVPPQAMTRTVSPQDLGMQGAPGTYLSVKPTGDVSTIMSPQAGQQVTSGQGQPYQEAPIPGGSRDPNAPQARADAMRGYRQEIAPVLTAAVQLQRNINAVRAGIASQDGAGDIAIINGLQRLIDEGVVREGDVALQLKAQGINGGIAGLRGFIDSSGTFSPEIRSQLSRTAEDIYARTNGTFRDRVLPYQGIVERTYGPGAFNDVVPEETQRAMGWLPPRPGEQRGLDTLDANTRRFQQMARGPQAPAQGQPASLPPKDQLQAGRVYNTRAGPKRWTGTKFVEP